MLAVATERPFSVYFSLKTRFNAEALAARLTQANGLPVFFGLANASFPPQAYGIMYTVSVSVLDYFQGSSIV